MGFRKDITGVKFGKLTVVAFHSNDNSGKNSRWECLCECGKTCIVGRPCLNRGQHSCGCDTSYRKFPPKKTDIQGQTFNFLTAIEPLGGKYSIWLCRCICGKNTNVQKQDLMRKKAKSCGCIKPDHRSNLEHLLKKTIKTEYCWIYKGFINPVTGYGSFLVHQKCRTAHRASWIFHNGDIPKGMMVCHSCDNRICVNPDHLWLGTQKDNMQDAKIKGRLVGNTGKKHSAESKLKMSEVKKIRAGERRVSFN